MSPRKFLVLVLVVTFIGACGKDQESDPKAKVQTGNYHSDPGRGWTIAEREYVKSRCLILPLFSGLSKEQAGIDCNCIVNEIVTHWGPTEFNRSNVTLSRVITDPKFEHCMPNEGAS